MFTKHSTPIRGLMKMAIVAVVFTGLGILLASSLNWSPSTHADDAQKQIVKPIPRPLILSGGESPFVAVAEKVMPAVVNVRSEIVVKRRIRGFPFEFYFEDPFEDFFRDFFRRSPREDEGQEYEQRSEGRGSGVIIDQEGYILTNNHVVEGAEEVKVKLSDDREFETEIVGTDPMTDIALLKIKEDGIITSDAVAQLGDSDRIRIGDWAIAIGNPFGLDRTVTVGVVSAKGRSGLHIADSGGRDRSPTFQDFIQTDASINFGNSGGPLVDINGEVIGINTAINTQGQGIGFAIPINIVKQIAEQLKESGKVVRGYLGIWFSELSPDIIEAKDLDVSSGIIVDEVVENSPADKAGLKQGDVVISFDGKEIESNSQFQFLVAGKEPGKKVDLEIIRNGKRNILVVELGERESEEVVQEEEIHEEPWLGLTVENITRSYARQHNIDDIKGVLVVGVEPGSPADDKNIRQGDIILEVDGQTIESVTDYRQVVSNLQNREKAILFLVKRGERTSYVALKPEKK
jgi:serine protease Do